ncbi:hypothetical protein GKIL_2926 [Gloeobacter kilaueensis JS1]|uniref:Uncharacterized protein n=1 Tax=Gloeobacter kilaueensis (strain ATCC BAA-2537 / CCAP 1431/1 / ULC 316 / JS1) TaxID=1183438 RepID=U5QJK2_GLOK1|nr:hypothetical protein GKIL_2926 [Gloeobacter kilaueensis JS1]
MEDGFPIMSAKVPNPSGQKSSQNLPLGYVGSGMSVEKPEVFVTYYSNPLRGQTAFATLK